MFKSIRNNKHLTIWLKLHNLQPDLHDQLVIDCMDDIVNTVGHMNILNAIIEKCNETHLQSIHNILKQQIAKQKQLPNPIATNINNNPTEIISLNDLPNDTLLHMLIFLNKSETINFKHLSRKMAIISLQHMSKLPIGICNANELITHPKDFINFNFFDNYSFIKYYRHTPSTTYQSLYELYSKYYQINIHNQILMKVDSTKKRFSLRTISSLEYNEMKTKAIQQLPTYAFQSKDTSYLLFDSRNIVAIEPKSAYILSEQINNNFDDYNLCILKYFDLYTQKHSIVQFLMIHPKVNIQRIKQYILTEYICINNANNINWYTQMMTTINQMDSLQHKLCIFNQRFNTKIRKSKNKQSLLCINNEKCKNKQVIVLQLNTQHTYFKNNTQQFQNIKNKCLSNFVPWFDSFDNFGFHYRHQRTVNCVFSDEYNSISLKSIFEKILPQQIQPQKRQLILSNCNKLSQNGINIQICSIAQTVPLSYFCECISYAFGNYISSNNIEFASNVKHSVTRIIKTAFSMSTDVSFKFVLYDTQISTTSYYAMDKEFYRINIFGINDLPYPYRDIDKAISIKIAFGNTFKIQNFINYIVSLISDNRFYLKQFDDITQNCLINMENEMNNIEFILSAIYETNDKKNYYKHYDLNEIFEYDKDYDGLEDDLDLYIKYNKCMNETRNIPLTVKFSNSKLKIANSDNINQFLVGLDMTIWINKTDTICDILQNQLKHLDEEDEIKAIYRVMVNNNNKIKNIPPRIRDEYVVFNEFANTYTNDFMVIKTANMWTINSYQPN